MSHASGDEKIWFGSLYTADVNDSSRRVSIYSQLPSASNELGIPYMYYPVSMSTKPSAARRSGGDAAHRSRDTYVSAGQFPVMLFQTVPLVCPASDTMTQSEVGTFTVYIDLVGPHQG